MFNFPAFTIWSLWIILVFFWSFAWVVMSIGDKLRGVKIENKEDHRNIKIAIISMMPIMAWFILSVFTPIVTGSLFWIGFALLFMSGIIHVSSITAFVKARSGLTTLGIYQFSRNPMYVAMFIGLIALVLMAWSASPLMGLLTIIITIWCIATTHWMVLREEWFLEKKYGETYIEYKGMVSRYLSLPHRKDLNIKDKSFSQNNPKIIKPQRRN